MRDRVLIVTGGMLTGEERSLLQAARKWSAQWSLSRASWLDVAVKLNAAEPLVAARLEQLGVHMRRGEQEPTIRRMLHGTDESDTPSLTAVVLATLLRRAGVPYETMTLDTLFCDRPRAERLIRETSYVFLSTTYLHDLSELEPVVARLKRPHNRLVAGGALAAILCHEWEGMPGVDVLAIGYGELLVDKLVEWMRSGSTSPQAPPGGRIEHKRHTCFLYGGVPSTSDLDWLPTPDWDLPGPTNGSPQRMVYYESVRGCPYRCNFCNYPFLFDDTRFRHKSATKIADDWQHYVDRLNVEYITCLDSLFTVPRGRLRELCRLLVERRIRVKWICYARADDLADEETVVMMRRAGAHQVQIGIESGDQTQLDNMNKSCTVEANARALKNCRKHGLTSIVSLIVGFPGETAETLETTRRFLAQNPPDFYFLATFSTRVPGVPLLLPGNRRRFGLEVMSNLHSMSPYWRHATMSCTEVGPYVRALDGWLMRERVSLNATLFHRGMLTYAPEDREPLLDFQRRVASEHPLVAGVFRLAHRWVGRRLERDVAARLPNPSHRPERKLGDAGSISPGRQHDAPSRRA